jgi:hypothetical protein
MEKKPNHFFNELLSDRNGIWTLLFSVAAIGLIILLVLTLIILLFSGTSPAIASLATQLDCIHLLGVSGGGVISLVAIRSFFALKKMHQPLGLVILMLLCGIVTGIIAIYALFEWFALA